MFSVSTLKLSAISSRLQNGTTIDVLGSVENCKAALDRILNRPEQGTIDADGVRSVRLQRFPYVVHFRMEQTTVVVFAILFGGRDPSAWRNRV